MLPELARPKNPVAEIPLLLSDVLHLILEYTQILPLLGLLTLLPMLKEQWSSSSRSAGVREGGVGMVWEVLNTCNASQGCSEDSGVK